MNRSRHVSRKIDQIDREIILVLSKNSRVTVRELAAQVGLSSPSVSERIHKLEDAGAISGYTISVEPRAFGWNISAHVTLSALPGEVHRVMRMLVETPQVIEADRVTGRDCFVAKILVAEVEELESVIDRFVAFASTETAVVHSSPVVRRLPTIPV